MAVYDLVLFINLLEPSKYLSYTWSFVFLILIVMWVDLDSKEQKNIYRPYEHGFLAFIFWMPYLPYYFIKTRKAKGLVLLFGLLLLFNLGYLMQWIYYLAS